MGRQAGAGALEHTGQAGALEHTTGTGRAGALEHTGQAGALEHTTGTGEKGHRQGTGEKVSTPATSPIVVVGGDYPARLVICVHCTRITTAETEFPVILRKWTDLPLPAGWIWTMGEIPTVAGPDPCMVPMCGTCAALAGRDLEAFDRRRLESRDLKMDGR